MATVPVDIFTFIFIEYSQMLVWKHVLQKNAALGASFKKYFLCVSVEIPL